ncbi:hypothetical protein C0991_007299 [Blastosporella zonata]|nr:hypothetical protein C0991_007299 [Blastosporella zonata]
MLQTISYILYLALGAGVFAALEGWAFCDGLYWADYTLLTIGIGSDFPLHKTVSRALLIPYAALGIMMIGLLVGSVRGLVLERGKMKVARRSLAKQRMRLLARKRAEDDDDTGWKKGEFECMRRMERRAHYTTLLTIGYGDFFPQSNSGKPFFVVWSLIAVPTVTVLISNLGDTVIGYLKHGLLWVGRHTLLPERRHMHMPRHNRKAQGREKAAAGDTDTRAHQHQPNESGSDSTAVAGLGEDIERLGEAVEKGEQKQRHDGSLAAIIAREIGTLAKDVGTTPAVKYGWEEWVRWLDLLGMPDYHKPGEEEGNVVAQTRDWTWLADDGPLFSRATETEWILGKLCERLEKALENELRDARRSSSDVE